MTLGVRVMDSVVQFVFWATEERQLEEDPAVHFPWH